ncbi:MAG: hypothetical protein RI957_1577 [Verrucomicrobiota bacterium]|jgi:GH35 family endo-1,4-beta-xylanase
MKRFLFLLLCLPPASGIDIPASGMPLELKGLAAHVFEGHGRTSSPGEGKQQIEVSRADSSRPFVAQCSVTATKTQKIAKNSPLLAVVRCRSLTPKRTAFLAKWQLGAAPYSAYTGTMEVPVNAEWQDYPVLLITQEDIDTDRLQMTMLCGQQEQEWEIAQVRAWIYPPGTDVSQFPRIRRSYEGREPNAAWRADALKRIESERKKNFQLTLRDEKGKLVRRREVTLSLRRHAFGFGSAIPVSRLLDPSADGEEFRRVVDRYFSMVVFENDLKDYGWNPDAGEAQKQKRNQQLDQALAWLEQRKIAVRGHYLMQTARPHNLHGKSAEQVRRHYLESTRERLAFVGNRVCEWDVINHPVAWAGADLLTKHPGLERIDREVFDLARQLSTLPFFVNEDQIFRPGAQSDGTFSYLQSLKSEGYPVAGLGNQAHFDESYLPSPVEMLATTDRFAAVAPKQIITEFDVVTTADEALAADFTRDAMIAAFSHHAYHGFMLWGFWEGSHWKPQAASWNRDWTIRGRGQSFVDLVGRQWHTEVTLTTDENGNISWRGFPGWYEIKGQDVQQWQEVK